MKEVKIGNQIWMTENLNVDQFRNGNPIPEAKTDEEWIKAGENGEPAWCYYENNPAMAVKYGKLYNWFAVNDPRGLAPKDCHIPSDQEWTALSDYLGGVEAAGTPMKSTSQWDENGNGTNASGFSGVPSGRRSPADADLRKVTAESTLEVAAEMIGLTVEALKKKLDGFFSIGRVGFWWSSTEHNTVQAIGRNLHYGNGNLHRNNFSKTQGFSVRCLKD